MNSKEPQDYDSNDYQTRSLGIENNNQSGLSHTANIDSQKELSEQEFPHHDLLQTIYQGTTAAICAIEVLPDEQYRYLAFNPICDQYLGISTKELVGKSPAEIFSAEDAKEIVQNYTNCVRLRQVVAYEEGILAKKNDHSWWITTLNPQINANGVVYRLISTSVNLNPHQQTEDKVRIQANREQLLSAIALRIRQSLNLDTILQQTVEEVRSFLQTDRVLIYRFDANWQGSMAVESVVAPWQSVLSVDVHDPCFTVKLIDRYRHGKIQAIEDVRAAELSPCYAKRLTSCQVKANLVVPIVTESKLWGLLIAQHCRSPRKWQTANIELLQQLATGVGIAVQQAELHQKVQDLNIRLEAQVEQRTAELLQTLQKLQQALKSEALVRSITKAIRDSLDEKQILQTATRSLARGLNIECCQIELYKHHHTTTEVEYEYPIVLPDDQGIHRQVADFPELYAQLLARKPLHFVDLLPTVGYRQQQVTRLACPIFDDRGILGNLWLLRPPESWFESWEIQLVQQIADQCAIAIRQARLYEAEQIQVRELEKLNLVKDDFLKTISHELRTPMSSIRLAVSTLETLLETEIGAQKSPTIDKVMNIFHSSFRRQNQLVDDLLTLCYVDVASKPDLWQSIDLGTWIPQIVKTYLLPTQQHHLHLELAEELPPLHSEPKMLQRVVNELLNNAYKYTPAGGLITIRTGKTATKLLLSISNSGVEIPPDEQERIFDKFYRIPNHDPWQHGGTGIGLALVKKLVELLEGEITVNSQNLTTTFTIFFPLN